MCLAGSLHPVTVCTSSVEDSDALRASSCQVLSSNQDHSVSKEGELPMYPQHQLGLVRG